MGLKNRLFPNLKRLTTIFSLVILGLTLMIITLRLTAFSDRASTTNGDNGAVLGASDVVDQASDDPSAPEGATVGYSINKNIYFDDPDAAGEIAIENPKSSEYDLRVTITRNDNGKNIYASGALRPGSTIRTAKIQGARLPEGVYECTAEMTTYEVGTSKKVNSTTVPITIYIGEQNMP